MLWEPVLREDRVAYWALLFCAKQKRAAVVHSSSSSPPTFWVWNQFGNSWIYFFGNICFFGGGSLGSLYLQRKTSIFARFSCENLQFQVFLYFNNKPSIFGARAHLAAKNRGHVATPTLQRFGSLSKQIQWPAGHRIELQGSTCQTRPFIWRFGSSYILHTPLISASAIIVYLRHIYNQCRRRPQTVWA